MCDSEHTNLDKLRRNIAAALAVNDDREMVVLVSTGGLNPVHLGHVAIFDIAKKTLEGPEYNLNVVGGFLSPSHDQYIRGKLGKDAMSSQDRIAMVNLATQDSQYIASSAWEVSQPRFCDFPYVRKAIDEFIQERIIKNWDPPSVTHELSDSSSNENDNDSKNTTTTTTNNNNNNNDSKNDNNLVVLDDDAKARVQAGPSRVRVLYLCGADHVDKCGLLYNTSFGTVGVGRDLAQNVAEEAKRIEQEERKAGQERNFWFVEGEEATFFLSSSKIRDRIKAGQSLENWTHPAVAEYIRTNMSQGHYLSLPSSLASITE